MVATSATGQMCQLHTSPRSLAPHSKGMKFKQWSQLKYGRSFLPRVIVSFQFGVSLQHAELGVEGSDLWLAVSADRRVSVWVSDWMKDKCELLDWLSFPAPAGPEVRPPFRLAISPLLIFREETFKSQGIGFQVGS